MSAILSAEVIELINDPETTKVLATIDGEGRPHVVVRNSLHVGDDGGIHLLELLETSATGRNLLGSLWFDRKVAIGLEGKDGRHVQIKGRPVKSLVSGPIYLRHYLQVRERLGDVDLAAVWIIEADEVRDENFATHKARQDAERPTFIHLDRLARQEAVLP